MDDTYKIISIIVSFIVVLKFLEILLKPRKKNRRRSMKQPVNNRGTAVYAKRDLLTDYERVFYYYLKNISDDLNLCVLAKIRLADLVDIVNYKSNSEFYSLFGKIKSKHIDFALADTELNIKLIIELDDSSHLKRRVIEKDLFKDKLLTGCGYRVLRVNGSIDLKEKIEYALSTGNNPLVL